MTRKTTMRGMDQMKRYQAKAAQKTQLIKQKLRTTNWGEQPTVQYHHQQQQQQYQQNQYQQKQQAQQKTERKGYIMKYQEEEEEEEEETRIQTQEEYNEIGTGEWIDEIYELLEEKETDPMDFILMMNDDDQEIIKTRITTPQTPPPSPEEPTTSVTAKTQMQKRMKPPKKTPIRKDECITFAFEYHHILARKIHTFKTGSLINYRRFNTKSCYR